MNTERRKQTAQVATELRLLVGKIEDCQSVIENLRDEEQEYFDTMPESLQQGDKGTNAEEAISNYESAIYSCHTSLEEAANYLECIDID